MVIESQAVFRRSLIGKGRAKLEKHCFTLFFIGFYE